MYKIVIFDQDGTLTKSRRKIEKRLYEALMKLRKITNVGIISGADFAQIKKQIPNLKNLFILPQSGNIFIDNNGKKVWEFKMKKQEIKEALNHIKKLKKIFPIKPYTSEDDTIEIRGSQVSYSPLGHNAPLKLKEKFDPSGKIRKMWLKKVPLKSKIIEARIAGTTSIDYTPKGRSKGDNIKRLLKLMGWKKNDCLFVGDALYPGGNDESVIGVCDTKMVKNTRETHKLILKLIKSQKQNG